MAAGKRLAAQDVQESSPPDRDQGGGARLSALLAQPRFKRLIPLLLICAFTVVFFAPFLFQGKIFLAADALYQYYPWKSYAPPGFRAHNTLITDPVNMNMAFMANFNQELKQGRFTIWNPNVLGGVPAFGGRSYPPKVLLHWLFDTPTALMLMIVLHLFLMGWFMHLYLKEIGAGARGALFGAVAFMFNGCAMVWLSFETVIPNAAYVPLLLLIMERFRGRRRLFWALLGAAVLGLVCLVGHVQYLIYMSLILVFYAIFMIVRAALAKDSPAQIASLIGCCAVMALGGALIGVMEIVPAIDMINVSSRAARTFDFKGFFAMLGRVPLRSYITLIFPDYFGSPPLGFNVFVGPPGEYTNYNELCLYAGVPTLFALLALLVRPKSAHARFYIALTVFLVAMMAGTFVFRPFFAWYPGMNKLAPMRLIFIFSFAVSAAAGLGVKNLEEFSPRARGVFVALVAALAALATVVWYSSSSPALINYFHADQIGTTGMRAAQYQAALARFRAPSAALMLKPFLIALGAAALFIVCAVFRGRRAAALAFAAAIVLLGYDLISFGWGYNTLVTPDLVFARTPSITFLQQQPGPFRVVQDTGRGLYVNTMVPFGIQEIGGYQSVYPDRVNKLLSYIEYGPASFYGQTFDRWVMFNKVIHPFYDVLNVRYVLTAPGVRFPEEAGYRLVFNGDMSVYENTRVLPRAFAVHRSAVLGDVRAILSYMDSPGFDPRREVVLEETQPEELVRAAALASRPPAVTISSYGYQEVRIAAELAAPGWVVLADSEHPGWVATVDGKGTPILRADCALRAVTVPAGRHDIVFRYRPASLIYGRLVSSLCAFLLAIGMVLAWRRTAAPENRA